MTATVTARHLAATPSRTVLTDCVRVATAAPSLHNSQPWRFRIADDHVDVYADRTRRLTVVDPTGRELMMSVGAALFTLRLALREAGCLPVLNLFPRPGEPDLAARVSVGRRAAPSAGVTSLAMAVQRRRTNRHPFARTALPAGALDRLRAAARLEGASLAVAGPADRDAVLALARSADQDLRARDGYAEELARWTHDDRHRRDGVPATAIGPRDALQHLPVRDFRPPHAEHDLTAVAFEAHPTIALLTTPGDTEDDWIMAGQALQRVLLTATTLGVSAMPMSQPIELPAARSLLTGRRTGERAQMVLRLGYGRPVPATPRRPVTDVLVRRTKP
ncbi:Acg family FMN-binding oxidoreductase [Actinoplanes sp. NPDC049316]|uniref:Acg family FMN-binding oxidoreductase n=1 Tax=Actinoplanes sp. NPDC049316 TaxID=3154727 RepID=UPI00343C15D8